MAQIFGQERRLRYTATAGQKSFDYNFIIYSAAELVVQKNDTTLVLNTDYTVTGYGTSSSDPQKVILTTGAALNDIIIITANTIVQRTTTFQPGGAFTASALNSEFNILDNCFKEVIASETDGFSLSEYNPAVSKIIPNPVARKALVWNAAATALTLSTYDPDTQQSAAASSAAAAATSAASSATSATSASTSATTATTKAAEAASSAASINLPALASDIIPDTDKTRNLGDASNQKNWNNIYTENLFVTNVTASKINNLDIQKPLQYMIVMDIKAQNEPGGAYLVDDTWYKRDLNTVKLNNIPNASLSSNNITLPEGIYSIDAYVPAVTNWVHQIRLFNETTQQPVSPEILGQSSGASLGSIERSDDYPSMTTILNTIVTVVSPVEIAIYGRCHKIPLVTGSTPATFGMGRPSLMGTQSFYSSIKIIKLS